MIRKGTVFILTNHIDEVFNYISSNLHTQHCTIRRAIRQEKEIMVNDYRIVIKHNINESARAIKPELSYIIGDIKIPMISERFNFLEYVSHLTTRKEPIRRILDINEIDIREFIDDEYAEATYCDQRKLNKWN